MRPLCASALLLSMLLSGSAQAAPAHKASKVASHTGPPAPSRVSPAPRPGPAPPRVAPATATLKAPYDEFSLSLLTWNGAGIVSATGKGGAAAVVPGDYWVVGWSVRVRDASGRVWRADGGPQGQPQMGCRLRSGTTAEMRPATPIRAVLAVDQVENQFAFAIQFHGSAGDRCTRVSRDGQNPPAPKLRITDADGAPLAVFDFKYG